MKKNRGFIKTIIIVIVALIVLGYFGFDLRKAIEAPATQNNLTYVQQIVSDVWHKYLKGTLAFIWERVILPLIQMLSVARKS